MNKPDFITIHGKQFARTPALLVGTLFNASGTASGIYKARKNGVLLMRGNGEPFAFLVANPGQSQFLVSCSRQPDGRIWYAFALSSKDEEFFGATGVRPSAQSDECARVWRELNAA